MDSETLRDAWVVSPEEPTGLQGEDFTVRPTRQQVSRASEDVKGHGAEAGAYEGLANPDQVT